MKRIATVIFVVGIASSFSCNGIASGKPKMPLEPSGVISEASSTQHHSYDVLKYNLFMDWYDVLSQHSLRYYGLMKITLKPDLESPLDSVSLDVGSQYLTVDSVYSGATTFHFTTSNGTLTVDLDKPYYSTDTAIISLYYHVDNPGLSGYTQQRGFYFYYGGEPLADGYVVPQTVAYTMSEPSDARYWMPCYDDPSDKALEEVTVRVPTAYTAASNGKLLSVTDNGDGSRTFHWQENFPVATYLMCVTASVFSVVQTNYVRAPGDTIPVQYYVYPEDSSTAVSNSDTDIDTVVSMLKFYSSIYGEYPFEKYAMTEVEPFKYGGMEHTTMTTIKRGHEFTRLYVAHELAHHWWGDNVTLGTWKDIWLNEGFAVYSEALELRHLNPQSFKEEMDYYASEYFQEYDTTKYPIYAPPPGLIFGLAEYYKAAWVLRMFNSFVGDSTYFSILHTYLADFRFGNAVTSDLINVASEVAHFDLSWFFDEWIYGEGYPIYSYSYQTTANSITFYLMQEQNGAPIFKMPVDIGLYSGGQETVLTFVDSLRLQTVRFSCSSPIDSVVLDPGDKILKQITAPTDLTLPKLSSPPSITLFPNPFNGNTQIEYSFGSDSHVTIDVYDIIGRKIKSLDEGYQQAGAYIVTFNGEDLASGVYLFKIHTGSGDKTNKVLLLK
ncbi:MAG: M1 family aminopeptidase [Candidatus Kryptoniota bacterium]